MKKPITQIWVFLAPILMLVGCLKAPDYSDIPSIRFKNLEFVDVDGGADSLRLTFDFEDGDGDIGLRDVDVYSPYHPFYVIVDSEDSLVTLSSTTVNPPFYAADENGIQFLFSEEDNRTTFNCNDYYFEADLADTFFVSRNEYHSNMHLKFFKKKNGQYLETSIAKEFNISDCNEVVENLRIPIFDYERIGKPTIGNITYAYLSNGIKPFLAQDTFKLEFYIYDRALNPSNTIQTPDFVLSDIIKR